MVVLSQDTMPPGMTPLEWSQAQARDSAICQIVEAIQHKTLGKLKIKKDMPLDLKAFLRIRKQFKFKQEICIEDHRSVVTEPGSN